jgi:beta-glucosidase
MTTDPRVEALLEQMTLDEKVGQLVLLADSLRPYAADVNPDSFQWNAGKIVALIRAGSVGGLFNGVGAREGREAQRLAVEESRLGIPLLFGADLLHGMRTVFPIPLGESASFEPGLAERTARAIAVEATAEGIHWTFAPMADVARDQRWGRVAESAGEDTLLACRFAEARVRGFQGSDLRSNDSLLSTPKHFGAYGAVSAGLDYNSADLSAQALYEIHLPPFRAAIRAGALTVMSAFNDLNGVPATANRYLLTEILREQWGFQGFVVSDYTSDFELIAHGYAADEADAARLCIHAGLDMSLQSNVYLGHLADAVHRGSATEASVTEAARRVLTVKSRMGLFDNPYRSLDPDIRLPPEAIAAHLELAREAARRSIVLLKNEGGILPLRREGQRIALVGPFCDDHEHLAGCWDLFGDKSREVDIASGLREQMATPAALTVVRGCESESRIAGGIEAAISACKNADVVLLALGEPKDFTGEAQSRTHLRLPAPQLELAQAVTNCGRPVVLLLRNGRAIEIDETLRKCGGLLVTWFLGSRTGPAIADIVFGAYSPSARLPVSFPHVSGQQPYFYNHVPTGRPHPAGDAHLPYRTRWRDADHSAQYPFGHGLTYTTFEYGAPRLDAAELAWDGVLRATARITNTGSRNEEEVVQLYVNDCVASRVRPVRELKDFQKVAIPAGESREVTFELRRADLEFRDVQNMLIAEPGDFDLWIAPSAAMGTPVRFSLCRAAAPVSF